MGNNNNDFTKALSMRLWTVFTVVLGVVLLSKTLCAHPLEVYSIGARSTALAGADLGSQSDYASGFANPASAAFVKSPLFSTGALYFANEMRLGNGSGGVEPASGVFATFVYPIEISKKYKLRWGSGLAIYVPQQRVVRIRFLPPYVPRFLQFDNRIHRLVATFFNAVSWHGLSLGIGINLFASADGRGALFKMRSTPGKYEVSDADLNLSLATLLYPSVGLLWQTRLFSIGFFYIRRVQLDISTATDADMHIELSYATLEGTAGSSLYAVNYFTPDTYGVGASAIVIPQHLKLYASLLLLDWKHYPGAAVKLVPKINLQLSGNDFPVEVVLYNYTEPEFTWQFAISAGIEATFEPEKNIFVSLRTGYRYTNSPIKKEGEIILLDNPRHCISAGAGIRIPPVGVLGFETEFNIAMAVQLLEEQTYEPTQTSPVKPFEYGGYIVGGSADVVLHF